MKPKSSSVKVTRVSSYKKSNGTVVKAYNKKVIKK